MISTQPKTGFDIAGDFGSKMYLRILLQTLIPGLVELLCSAHSCYCLTIVLVSAVLSQKCCVIFNYKNKLLFCCCESAELCVILRKVRSAVNRCWCRKLSRYSFRAVDGINRRSIQSRCREGWHDHSSTNRKYISKVRVRFLHQTCLKQTEHVLP